MCDPLWYDDLFPEPNLDCPECQDELYPLGDRIYKCPTCKTEYHFIDGKLLKPKNKKERVIKNVN